MLKREDQIKAMASEMRMDILRVLGEPARYFAHQDSADPVEFGVCVQQLAAHFSVGQPTMSRHLELLRRAGFIRTLRKQKWAYCSRDEAGLRDYTDWLTHSLSIGQTGLREKRGPAK